jgi:SRSO17 transposase
VPVRPYTSAHHFPQGKKDPDFQSKLQIAVALATQAKAAGLVFRAVAADCAYNNFRAGLHAAGLVFVMTLKPRHGTWAYDAGTLPSTLHTP